MLIQLCFLLCSLHSALSQNDSDYHDLVTTTEISENVESSLETVPSLYLGHGYNMFYANPLTEAADLGLTWQSAKPQRLLQLTLKPGHTCPDSTQCLNLTIPQRTTTTVVARSLIDWQNQVAKLIHFNGAILVNVSAVGLLNPNVALLARGLDSGSAFIDEIEVLTYQEAKLLDNSLPLNPKLAGELCQLPEPVDGSQLGKFINLQRSYGTHIVEQAAFGSVSIRRTKIERMWIQKAVNEVGILSTDASISLANLPHNVIHQALLLQNNSAPALIVNVTLPIVQVVRELAEFVTRNRLLSSSLCQSMFAETERDQGSSYVEEKLAHIRDNLRKAMLAFGAENQRYQVPSGVVTFKPSPLFEDDCSGVFFKSAVKFLGLGYNFHGSNIFSQHGDAGFHLTPTLLKTKPCHVSGPCKTMPICREIERENGESHLNFVWDQEDLKTNRQKHVEMLDQVEDGSSGIGDSLESFPFVDKLTISSQVEVALKFRFLSLDSHFIQGLCELPVTFDSQAISKFIKEFGSEIVWKLRWGNFSVIRTFLPRAKTFDFYSVRKVSNNDTSDFNRTLMHQAMRQILQDHVPDENSQILFRKQNAVVHIHSRSIAYFVTPDRIADANLGSQCHHLQSPEAVQNLQQNLKNALSGNRLASSAISPIPEFTTTKSPSNTVKTATVDQSNEMSWPAGTYGLMEANEGCPVGGWYQGSRFQDLEDKPFGSSASPGYFRRTTSSLSHEGIIMNFCVKTQPFGREEGEWPSGAYCIFKKFACPPGFKSGSVEMDDENTRNGNRHSGTLPDGHYDWDTRYDYCCRADGDPMNAIHLPNTKPFFLMANSLPCQQVAGMESLEQYLTVDCEDNPMGRRFPQRWPWPYGRIGLQSIGLGQARENGDWQWNLCYYKPIPTGRHEQSDLSQEFSEIFLPIQELPELDLEYGE